ncbi:MAG: hypothetical protein SynsKO_17940 [Synoicihabitans sp.]
MSDSDLAAQWEEARKAFATSIMVDTALSSLAENLDGPEWPGTGKKDCPADYIDLTYEEVVEMLAMRGYPEGTVNELITILTETLAFDDPFGDMVEHSETVAESENPLLDNLKKLEIPEDYPIALTHLSKEAKEFCELEGLTTLSEFAVFAQGMAQNVVVGGDFKTLLNALSHVDERGIAQTLPFRPGHKGLHLVEALGGVVRGMKDLERQNLRETGEASATTRAQVGQLTRYFADDLESIKTNVDQGVELSREVMVLQDPSVEPLVGQLLASYLPKKEEPKKSGWFGRLFGR